MFQINSRSGQVLQKLAVSVLILHFLFWSITSSPRYSLFPSLTSTLPGPSRGANDLHVVQLMPLPPDHLLHH